MVNGYLYTGPLPLGSVVAHNCGAAGLFSDKVHPEVILEAHEMEGMYTLTVTIGDSVQIFEGPVSSMGRRQIGQALLRYLREYQGLPAEAPWGTMVGVRPTKLLHKYIDTYGSVHAATRHIRDEFSVSIEKLATLGAIGEYQRPFLSDTDDKKVSLYCGIPFCDTRCVYCSFPYGLYQDYAGKSQFLRALTRDIEDMKAIIQSYNLTVDTLYMGGGTPTVLKDEDFHQVLKQLSLLVPEGHEFTVEAGRPDSVNPTKLRSMLALGVNRISINPQTMQDDILRRIENMDYVCQNLPENVTIHTLALKRGSPLYDLHMEDDIPEEHLVAEMVQYGKERLEAAGYVPYYLYRQQYMRGQLENIGYTLPGKACEYNIQIMEERQSILSMGPGSSSKWMRAPEYRQLKQHMPKDVDVYHETIDALLEKRHRICERFWEVV
ncbi:MAG: coproporphyrinogen III oxidase family protein [Veillonella sp.]|nr:coproporphyrinogen III oxidase family protein [Veillonella sp.]